MKRLTREELKQVQMGILDAVQDFCIKNNIVFSIGAGTMLGAVRHKGYIPWDDDIDIYMLREDYEKFERLFPSVYEGKYIMKSIYRDKNWHSNFAKIFDDRTITEQETRSLSSYGVDIDVFPIDSVPDDLEQWKKFINRLEFRYAICSNKARKVSHKRSLINNVGVVILSILLAPFSQSFLRKKLNKYIQRYNNKGFQNVYENSYGYMSKNPFPKSLFSEIIEWEFEDRKYLGFKNADLFLRLKFGNYMELPPEDKRVQHSEVAYWK